MSGLPEINNQTNEARMCYNKTQSSCCTGDLKDMFVINIFIMILALLIAFSPLLGFWSIAISLSFFSKYIDRRARYIAGFLLVLSGALIAASRLYFYETIGFSDDMIRYYESFRAIYYGSSVFEEAANNGYPELLLSFYFWLLSKLFGFLTPAGVAFFSSFFTATLFWLWVEIYALKEINPESRANCLAFCLVFFDFVSSTHIIRQMLSIPLVLFLISVTGFWKKTVFFSISILAHSTALPTFLIIWGLTKKTKITFYCIMLLCIFTIFSADLLSRLDVFAFYNIPVLSNLRFLSQFETISGGRGRFLITIIIINSLLFLILKDKNLARERWKMFFLAFAILYITFSRYGHLFRIALPYSACLLGYSLFWSFRKAIRCACLFLLFIALLRITITGFFFEGSTYLALWNAYPPASLEPFYFIAYLYY